MNLHEYQAKALLADVGVPVPKGKDAGSVKEALTIARDLGGDEWVVKAQVHAGGRGKAGGVKKITGPDKLGQFVDQLLSTKLVTAQTDAKGQPVGRVLVETPSNISQEYYLACLVDRTLARVVFIASAEGGIKIEDLAAKHPEKIFRITVNPETGLQADQCREFASRLNLQEIDTPSLGDIMMSMYRLFLTHDLSLLEINPLVLTQEGGLVALDAKIAVDDNAIFRQKDLSRLRDPTQEEPKEYKAEQFGLSYVALDGNIGCMVNGAGLAMATMDLIKLHGGAPANFLDVGGGATADKVAEALKIILSDDNVEAILVNIFGGIVRCDLIAKGIIRAVQEIGISLPIIVRLEGTRAKEGRKILDDSPLSITAAADLDDAASKAVSAVAHKEK